MVMDSTVIVQKWIVVIYYMYSMKSIVQKMMVNNEGTWNFYLCVWHMFHL